MILNILFGVAVMAAPVLFMLIVFKVLFPVLTWRLFFIASGVVLLISLFFSVQTYGPRLDTEPRGVQAYTPQAQQAENTKPLFTKEKSRFGEADERIDNEPVEKRDE